ncbi:hypothetical protein CR513_61865, partial [Mucuna pruriens]
HYSSTPLVLAAQILPHNKETLPCDLDGSFLLFQSLPSLSCNKPKHSLMAVLVFNAVIVSQPLSSAIVAIVSSTILATSLEQALNEKLPPMNLYDKTTDLNEHLMVFEFTLAYNKAFKPLICTTFPLSLKQ